MLPACRSLVALSVLIACAAAPLGVEAHPLARQAGAASASQIYTITRIDVTGAKRYAPADVIRTSGLAVGQQVVVADLDRAVRTMADSGLFTDVSYRCATSATGMILTLAIHEAVWDVPVIFDNFVGFTDDELSGAVRARLPAFDGTAPVNPGVPDSIEKALADLLRTRGIAGDVGYRISQKLGGGNRRYVFAITPGPRMCDLHITGTTAISERSLLDAAREATSGQYSRMYIDDFARLTLLQDYRHKGYWRAAFDAPAVTVNSRGCDGVDVTIHVNEGPEYVWDHIEWIGNTAIPSAQLDELMKLRPGDVADSVKVDEGLRAVHAAHAKIGYVTEDAAIESVFDDVSKRATLRIHVAEGPQYQMGRFTVVGGSPEQAKAITGKWKLAAGDVFDGSYITDFQSKVLNAYSHPPHKATLDGAGTDDHLVNVTVTLH